MRFPTFPQPLRLRTINTYEIRILRARSIIEACNDLEIPATVGKIVRISKLLGRDRVTIQQIKLELKHLNEVMQDELRQKMFFSVPPTAAALYENPNPFGDAVSTAFPSAAYDIQEAAKCFACERYTGAIFHSMCATEYALRSLANDRRVLLTTGKNGKGRPFPTQMGTWEDILKPLHDEIAKISNWSRSKGDAKIQALQFYNSAFEDLKAIKEAWRNPVMHARTQYMREDAEQVMAHVLRLMQSLSTRITETERTPRVWTKAQLR